MLSREWKMHQSLVAHTIIFNVYLKSQITTTLSLEQTIKPIQRCSSNRTINPATVAFVLNSMRVTKQLHSTGVIWWNIHQLSGSLDLHAPKLDPSISSSTGSPSTLFHQFIKFYPEVNGDVAMSLALLN